MQMVEHQVAPVVAAAEQIPLGVLVIHLQPLQFRVMLVALAAIVEQVLAVEAVVVHLKLGQTGLLVLVALAVMEFKVTS